MMPTAEPNLKAKLIEALSRDPKKTGVMAVLGLVMVILIGRQLVGGSTATPPAADAMTVAAPDAPPAPQAAPLKQSHKRAGSAAAFQQWLNKPVPKLERNLFAAQLDAFPLAPHAAQPEKSDTQTVDDTNKQQQAQIESARNKARDLRLQSTVMSVPPQAVINGQLVHEGDTLTLASVGSGETDSPASLQIVRIEPRRVIVKSGGVLLEVLMK